MPKLLEIANARGLLLAFHNHGAIVSVEKKNIKTLLIFKDSLSNSLAGMQNKSIFESMRVGGDEIRQRLLVWKVREEAYPVRWVIHTS